MVSPIVGFAAAMGSGICFVIGWYIWGVAFFDGTILEKILLVLLVVLVLSSGFILYCIRMFLASFGFMVAGNITTPELFLKDHKFKSFVWPSDLDIFIHMNNSRYARAADFARIVFFWKSGFQDFMINNRAIWVMSAATARYRKSLKIFQTYTITTKLLYWEDDAFYLEHKFTSKFKDMDNFVYCVLLCKMSVRGISTSLIRKNLLKMNESESLPKPSEELKEFIQYNQQSSLALRGKVE